MVLMVNDNVFGFAFAGKEGFDGRPGFLNVRNTFGVKVVQVFFLCMLWRFYTFTPLLFEILPV